jgi:hypothetical protein
MVDKPSPMALGRIQNWFRERSEIWFSPGIVFNAPYALGYSIGWEESMVTVIWDTWLKAGMETEGLLLTRQVWSDMRSFDGYVRTNFLSARTRPTTSSR